MVKDRVDDTIFLNILQICKNSNCADISIVFKQIIKATDFETITKEFLDDTIHSLIINGKIKNKINRNAEPCYVHEKPRQFLITKLL